jgi:ABC-type spermidine/putrescine transport system permease subunit I
MYWRLCLVGVKINIATTSRNTKYKGRVLSTIMVPLRHSRTIRVYCLITLCK